MYDVLIVGAGIVGCSLAYETSKYNLKVCVVERYNDVANGATKANSAILHAGFDCIPGTKAARLNLLGIEMAKEICEKLDVERIEMPSFVLAFNQENLEKIKELYERGQKNGVKDLKILSREEVLEKEKNINPNILGALYAPHSAIVNPWEYALAMAETAASNGVEFSLSTQVQAIEKKEGYFCVKTNKGTFESKYVVNAAGAFSADIYKMVGGNSFVQTNPCGQYYVLDKDQGSLVHSVIFQCPTNKGKGILVAPTVHGNLICGPDSFTVKDGDCVATVNPMLEDIKNKAHLSVPGVDFRSIIHEYAGVRPNSNVEDFTIEEAKECPGFVNLAGIRSPGLSAAPAIALDAIEILKNCGLQMTAKENYKDSRKRIKFRELSMDERKKLVKENPLYGRVICRCETVTEGEIVEALHRPIVPTTIDAIKRRCNAGMGRCQGGFCSPRVHEIIARELGQEMKDVLMDEEGSFIITSNIKEVSNG